MILGLFNSESAEGDKSIFEEVADKDGRAYRFALSSNEDVLKEMKVTKSAVYVYKPVLNILSFLLIAFIPEFLRYNNDVFVHFGNLGKIC